MSNSAQQSTARVKVPFGAWYAETELELPFPADWSVTRYDPIDAPEMSDDAIDAAFRQPIGAEPLRRLAAGRRTVAIAVDDLTRPTPAHRFLPRLLNELAAGGIARENICIIMGTAAHRPMAADEITRKLGVEIAGGFRVVMHDFMGRDNRFLGWIDGGPVYLNRHFLDADLRILTGGVIPHGETGFGGGAKMLLPGLAGRLSIAHFHSAMPQRNKGEMECHAGVMDRRDWIERVARRIGVHTAVCAVINSRRKLAGLCVGDVVAAHRAAATRAAALGRTMIPRDAIGKTDVVVVNAYPLDTDPIQMEKSIKLAQKLSARATVVVNAASDGIFYHGLGMGNGVDLRRLLRNVPRWLVNPVSQWAWMRAVIRALPRMDLAVRATYFAMNHLRYAGGIGGAAASALIPADDEVQRLPVAARSAAAVADPLVFSARFPAAGFHRKYRHGKLFRGWNDLIVELQSRVDHPRVGIFPCAPLQLLDVQE